MRKKKLSTLTAILILSIVISVSSAYASSFVDIENSYAKDAILELQAKGILNGIDFTHFDPKGTLTRAQFATIIVKALGLKTNAATSSFTDVSGWAVPYVEAARKAGVILGVGGGKFDPNASITREAAATILVRALKTKGTLDEEATLDFTDADKISKWARPYIAIAQKYGLIKGHPDGSFDPKGVANREMAAVMGLNLLIIIDIVVNVEPEPEPEPEPDPEPAPDPTPPYNGGGGGSYTPPVVEFLIKPSFTGAFTSDMKVRINGSFITEYSLYYNGDLVGTTINGIITSVNNVFSDVSKIKIQIGSVDKIDSDGQIGKW